MIVVCQCIFISCNKCITLVGMLIKGWLGKCGDKEYIGNLCYKLETALQKIKPLKKGYKRTLDHLIFNPPTRYQWSEKEQVQQFEFSVSLPEAKPTARDSSKPGSSGTSALLLQEMRTTQGSMSRQKAKTGVKQPHFNPSPKFTNVTQNTFLSSSKPYLGGKNANNDGTTLITLLLK